MTLQRKQRIVAAHAHAVVRDAHQAAAAGLAVLVGDVSGKGVSAAFYMAEMKGIFQALGKAHRDPAAPYYCDACFSGDYPITLPDQTENNGRQLSRSSITLSLCTCRSRCGSARPGSCAVARGADNPPQIRLPRL